MPYVVALDIGGTKIAGALVEIDATADTPHVCHPHEVAVEVQIPTMAQEGGSVVLSRVLSVVDQVIAAHPQDEIVAVGVSSAGVVNPRTGEITYANELMPGWGGTPLAHAITNRFGLPCKVLNDVHAHALGELRQGAGRGYSSALVAAIGTGIGGALIINGGLVLGAHDEAGHIGHVACPAAAGVPCSCGATGHLEPVASGPGIIQLFLGLGGAKYQVEGIPLDGAFIDRLAREGVEEAVQAQERAATALGEVLGSLCNMVDPEVIILSGSVTKCGPVWHEALARAFVSQAMAPVAATPLMQGQLGDAAPLIGAAEQVCESAYADMREH